MRIGDFQYSWRGNLNIRMPIYDGDIYVVDEKNNKIKTELEGYIVNYDYSSVNYTLYALVTIEGMIFVVPVTGYMNSFSFINYLIKLDDFVYSYDDSYYIVDDYVLKSPECLIKRFKNKNNSIDIKDYVKIICKDIGTFRYVRYVGDKKYNKVEKFIWLDKNGNSYKESYCCFNKGELMDMRSVNLC